MSGTDALKVRNCLASLDRTGRYVVLMYYADNLNEHEIGAVLDIPQARVEQTIISFRHRVAKLIDPCQTKNDMKTFADRWVASHKLASTQV